MNIILLIWIGAYGAGWNPTYMGTYPSVKVCHKMGERFMKSSSIRRFGGEPAKKYECINSSNGEIE